MVFFNIKDEKQLDHLIEKENALFARLELIEKSILNQKSESDFLFKNLLAVKKENDEFVQNKREELRQISNNLSITNDNTNHVADLLNKATELNSRIDSLLNIQEDNKVKTDKIIEDFNTLYTNTNDNLNLNSKSIDNKIEEFDKLVLKNEMHLKSVESQTAFFEERNNYLKELIGREVGVSLFETFKQRKVELRKSVDFWTIAVPVMSLVTVSWIYFVFNHLAGGQYKPEVWWQFFALNTLKTLPAVLLLIFTVNQYRNERNFQEEYAFKSAVALTIDAYANRISDLSNKDKLIMDAVLNMYKSPIKDTKAKVDIKKMLKIVKSINETTKESKKKD